MELTFSLAELNKKSPYMLESSGSYSFSFIKKNRVGSLTEVRVWLRNLDDPLFEKNKSGNGSPRGFRFFRPRPSLIPLFRGRKDKKVEKIKNSYEIIWKVTRK